MSPEERKAAIDRWCKARRNAERALARAEGVPLATLLRFERGANPNGQTWGCTRREGVRLMQRYGLLGGAEAVRWPWGLIVRAVVTPAGRRILWLHAEAMATAALVAPFPRRAP